MSPKKKRELGPCPPGKIRNPSTRRCKADKPPKTPRSPKRPKSPRSPKTQRHRKREEYYDADFVEDDEDELLDEAQEKEFQDILKSLREGQNKKMGQSKYDAMMSQMTQPRGLGNPLCSKVECLKMLDDATLQDELNFRQGQRLQQQKAAARVLSPAAPAATPKVEYIPQANGKIKKRMQTTLLP